MPKNIKGGKKGRRGKNEVEERYFEQKEDGQAYAVVTQYYGNGRVEVNCFIEKEIEDNSEENKSNQNNIPKEKEFENQTKLGIIRGSMRRRKYKNNVTVGSIVIVGIRDFEEGKCDIMHVYNNDEARKLKKMGDIPNVAVDSGSNGLVNEDDTMDFFAEEDEDVEDEIENI